MSHSFTSNSRETIKLSPWNKNNKYLTKDDVYRIYTKCGFHNVRETIKINDLSLYQTAFVHTSYSKKQDMNEIYGNKTDNMEFVPRQIT